MLCRSCRNKLEDGDKFCEKCGMPVPGAFGEAPAFRPFNASFQERMSENDVLKCPKCGAEFSRDLLFCLRCGEKINKKKGGFSQ